MRQLAAILGDSFREAVDRRVLVVLLALATVVIAFCFGISFSGRTATDALRMQAEELGRLRHDSVGIELRIADVRAVTASDDLPPAFADGVVAELAFDEEHDLDRLAAAWERRRARSPFDAGELGDPADVPPATAAQRERFLEERFAAFGYSEVRARKQRGEPARYLVAVRSDYPDEVRGAHTVGVLFGLWEIPLEEMSLAETVVVLQLGLANTFAGQLGMFIAVLVCAGFIPSLLQKGTLDLTLARPIGRVPLLLAKYVGGLWFVFVLAAYLVFGCWLALSLRTGYANPWYLATIATITLQFAVLYAVTVLVGVATRSGGLAALVTLGLWMVSSAVVGVRHQLDRMGDDVPETVRTAIDAAYTVLPKTADLGSLNALLLARSHLSPDALARRDELVIPDVDWAFALGTTGAFTAAMLALACWLFSRRDY